VLAELLRDPRDWATALPAIALMLVHKSERTLLPEARVTLRRGDRVLFCGSGLARARMEWTLQNDHALAYVQTGESHSPGTLWTWGSRTLGGRSRRRR
jgi:hypothetical protein